MNKLFAVVSAPVDTFSGYGSRARDFVKSLIQVKNEEWDIKILSQRWGECPFGALDENDPVEKDILNRIIKTGKLESQPDISIQISVSNEFQPIGKVNIGVSALVETTILPAEMLEGLNRMTFNIVSSNFVKEVAAQTTFEKIEQQTNKSQGVIKLDKNLEVLFEGVDTSTFKRMESSSFDLSYIEEEFCFLTVAHWLSGELGEDRKQLTTLIYSFLNAFKGAKKRPSLILKTSMAGFSIIEEELIIQSINKIRNHVGGDLPNIYLVYGEMTEQELNELYNHPKVKAFALVGNEGFGRPYLEFSAASSKPIIASPFSGHVDFLNKEFNIFVEGSLGPVHQTAANNFLLKEANWFKADPAKLGNTLKEVYNNYSNYVDMGKRQGHISRTQFNMDKMTEKLKDILDRNVPKISVPKALSLPKLKKITHDS